jgi:choice-of-anchor B domain-containing protein
LSIRRFCVPALLTAVLLVPGAAEAQVMRNFTLLSHVNEYPTAPNFLPYAYSACWSYIHPDGREYAILGVASGVAIYNVTDPTTPHRVGYFAGPPSIWREMKSYRNWIYVVTEGEGLGEGVQIIRMTDPEAPVLVNTYAVGFTHSHTISLDTTRAILLCNGTRDAAENNVGMHVLSLANPESPVEIARWPAAPYSVPPDLYVHDSEPIGNRLYASNIYVGTERVFDFTNPAAPTPIAAWTYSGAFYTHSAWPDPTGNWLYVTDEQNGQPLRVFDISLLGSPQLSDALTSNPVAIVHNPRVKGQELYLANYTEGTRALDLSDPGHPAEFGWADSYPGPSGGYSGVWDVCPYFPSGIVIASDMQTGLYVYQPVRNYGIVRVKVLNAANNQPLSGIRVRLTTQGDSLTTPADGIVQFAPSPGTHTVLAHAFGWIDASATRSVTIGSRDTVVLALTARPTATFTGVIRDSLTGAPLADAEVRLEYTGLHSHTDATGAYAFAGVPDDSYLVTIGRAGYAPRSFVRFIGPADVATDYRLKAARSYDELESSAGWAVGVVGDGAISGLWTLVSPRGTGVRPPDDAAQPTPSDLGTTPDAWPAREALAGALRTTLGGGQVQPLSPQHEEPALVITDNAAPYADHSPGAGTRCFVTGQGTDTTNVDQADLDGGRITLTSPALDMTGMTTPTIGYWRWFFSTYYGGTGQPDSNDWLAVSLSNDNGATWTVVDTTRGVLNHWQERAIRVADYVLPTAQVRVRFAAADFGPNTTVEAAIDDITTYDAATGSATVDPPPPAALAFRAPAPNPSSGAVRFSLDLPVATDVRIDVLDLAGRRVRELYRAPTHAGTLVLLWSGDDDRGRAAPPGVYFVRATAGGAETRTRLVRIR